MTDQEVIKLYQQGLSTIKIGKLVEKPTHKIVYILIKNNIPRRSNSINSRKYQVDHHFFDTIDTQTKAYWLGFIAADGYITRNGKQKMLGIALALKDKDHLEKFRNDIAATYPIHTYVQSSGYAPGTKYVRLLMTSKTIFDSLTRLGIGERKTAKLTMPDIPSQLQIHFIRGYFDGDGSWAKDKKTQVGFSFKVCGTKEMLTAIQQKLDTNSKLYVRNEMSVNNFYISVAGAKVYELMKTLYKDSTVHMDRKYNRYQQVRCPLVE